MNVIIFSGPVHSGKTTALQQWSSNRKDVGGILMPDIDGTRKFLNIQAKDIFDAGCKFPEKCNEALVSIGPYHFYESAFEQANNILKSTSKELKFIIIDEIGKLELQQKGLYEGTRYLLNNSSQNIILVVRDSLVKGVVTSFHLTSYILASSVEELQ
jgi:nucleoside-triphosphatase